MNRETMSREKQAELDQAVEKMKDKDLTRRFKGIRRETVGTAVMLSLVLSLLAALLAGIAVVKTSERQILRLTGTLSNATAQIQREVNTMGMQVRGALKNSLEASAKQDQLRASISELEFDFQELSNEATALLDIAELHEDRLDDLDMMDERIILQADVHLEALQALSDLIVRHDGILNKIVGSVVNGNQKQEVEAETL